LLEFVRLEFISSEILSKVLSYLKQVSPTLNRAIWNQITLKLKRNCAERPTSKLRYARPARLITKLNSLSPFFGIIDMLTKSCGRNVHDKGVLTVTPSAGGHAAMTCNTTVDYLWDSRSSSLSCANEWIRFDFKENGVKSNTYSIRAHTVRGTRLKSWVIEWSNDCVDWFELDQKTHNNSLTEREVVVAFKINRPRNCRFVKLRQIEANCDRNWTLGLAAMEFLGVLKVRLKCTYCVTGHHFQCQQRYQCITCGLAGEMGCCGLCAQSCH
jgi:hypothetical protein